MPVVKWPAVVAAFVVTVSLGAQAPAPAPPTAASPQLSQYKQNVGMEVDAMGENIQKMNDMVFSFAELGFQEFETSKYLTGILEQNGFKIERGVAGIPTPSGPTSTAFRRRRTSPASRITIRSSRARPATVKGTTPGCRCRSPRRSPSRR